MHVCDLKKIYISIDISVESDITMSDKLLLLLLLLFFYFSFFISYFSRSFSSGIDTDVSTEPEEYLLCFWFCWSTVQVWYTAYKNGRKSAANISTRHVVTANLRPCAQPQIC